MDGIHDLGGMHGFGAVPIEDEDYVFRHEWQRKSFALAQALASTTPYCADMHRHKIERIPAIDYLRMDYFEKWAIATSELLKDAGLVNSTELQSGKKEFDVDLRKHAPIAPLDLVNALNAGVTMTFPAATCRPQLAVGDSVRVRNQSSPGHTRVPRYVRGKRGTIIADMGVFQYADTIASGDGPHPQHCYTVAFPASTLWGEYAESPTDNVYMDLAEAYIELV